MLNRAMILNCDSYKHSHYLQYPPDTRYVYSYIESRGGEWDRTVMFGLQMFLKEYMLERITLANIDFAEKFCAQHGVPFNRAGWDYILTVYKGKLPISIKAVPEGTVLPTGNILVSVVNTDPECFWLTSFVETAILRAVWYPTTVATKSYMCKQVIRKYLEKTCDNPEAELPFKLHDFGARGVSSFESAAIGGCAHLVNFRGTDTMSGLLAAREYYGEEMAGFSIPAAEHSTITSWGKANEVRAYENMLDRFAQPGKLVAVVSDSYDIYHAVDNIWGVELRDKVINSGATLVVRPDSGVPKVVVVNIAQSLAEHFGYTINRKGYKVLHRSVRIIQGDGISGPEAIEEILEALMQAGFSAENVAFGMGGGLLQQVNRDTLKFAMKCSAVDINGEWHDVYKDPVTDKGKRSKRGRLALITENGYYETVPLSGNVWRNVMNEVYRNGELLVDQTFADVRARSEMPMVGSNHG